MKTPLFLSFAALLLLAACDDEDTSANNSSNNDNNANIYSEVPSTLEAFDDILTRWRCMKTVECCTDANQHIIGLTSHYDSYEACYENEGGRLVAYVDDATTFAVDPSALDDIWAVYGEYLSTTECDDQMPDGFLRDFDIAMDSMYDGLVDEGGACTGNVDCMVDLYCEGATGTCEPAPLLGETCNTFTLCAEGLMCNFGEGTCVEIFVAGEACGDGEGNPCTDVHGTLTCDRETDTCVARYEDGADCQFDYDCTSGTCGADGLCVPREVTSWTFSDAMCGTTEG